MNIPLTHLLDIESLDDDALRALIDLGRRVKSEPGRYANRLSGHVMLNLFFEASTRTRASFDLAAKRLGADVLNLDVNMSSRIKGESILDTIYTLQAMQVDVFVVRDASAGVPAYITRHVNDFVSVVNAGEADISHPTQGLLDLLTIRRHRADFENLTVAIVGDVAHSRVARSIADGLDILGVGELRVVCPPAFAPQPGVVTGARIFTDLGKGIRDADVVMALRIQRERIANIEGIPSTDEYFAAFGLTRERMKSAAPNAIVMHPGPMNRNVEIESELADGPTSVITQQVASGVAVRMAVLETVIESLEAR